MSYTACMNRFRVVSFAFVLAIVLFVGAFVVFTVPEAQAVRSHDGALIVTGLTRAAQQIAVTTDSSVAIGDPLLGLVYHIEPGEIALDSSIVLSFAKRL